MQVHMSDIHRNKVRKYQNLGEMQDDGGFSYGISGYFSEYHTRIQNSNIPKLFQLII